MRLKSASDNRVVSGDRVYEALARQGPVRVKFREFLVCGLDRLTPILRAKRSPRLRRTDTGLLRLQISAAGLGAEFGDNENYRFIIADERRVSTSFGGAY